MTAPLQFWNELAQGPLGSNWEHMGTHGNYAATRGATPGLIFWCHRACGEFLLTLVGISFDIPLMYPFSQMLLSLVLRCRFSSLGSVLWCLNTYQHLGRNTKAQPRETGLQPPRFKTLSWQTSGHEGRCTVQRDDSHSSDNGYLIYISLYIYIKTVPKGTVYHELVTGRCNTGSHLHSK